ncbi:MAG TPA: hypothetical protein VHK04_04760 [Castellaniella sp.]|jgi:hypothetical protein|nr:hypothetical protein [Castellaniella sp.]
MKTLSAENALRVEILRAHATLERQALGRQVRQVGKALKPAALLHEALPVVSNWSTWRLLQGLSLARRYPLLIAAASSVLTGRGKRRTWLRIGVGVLLGWQALRAAKAPRNRRARE